MRKTGWVGYVVMTKNGRYLGNEGTVKDINRAELFGNLEISMMPKDEISGYQRALRIMNGKIMILGEFQEVSDERDSD